MEVKEPAMLLFEGRAFPRCCDGPKAGVSGLPDSRVTADELSREVAGRACADPTQAIVKTVAFTEGARKPLEGSELTHVII